MASSGKQAFVGRRERTSLKVPVGEASSNGLKEKICFLVSKILKQYA